MSMRLPISSLRIALALCASMVLTLRSIRHGDLLVAVAPGDQAQHLGFAVGQVPFTVAPFRSGLACISTHHPLGKGRIEIGITVDSRYG